jgi:hypothetical protein
LVKNEKGDLLAISTVFGMGGSITSKFLNVQGVNYVRQTEIRITELLVLKPISFLGLDGY